MLFQNIEIWSGSSRNLIHNKMATYKNLYASNNIENFAEYFKYCPKYQINPLKIARIFLKYQPSGDILPDIVTLTRFIICSIWAFT